MKNGEFVLVERAEGSKTMLASNLAEMESDGSGGTEMTESTQYEVEPVEGYEDVFQYDTKGHQAVAYEGKPTEAERSVETLLELEQNAKPAWVASYGEAAKEVAEVVIPPDDRVQIVNTTVYPWRAICHLIITAQNGATYTGTGWFIGNRTVMTAGHCVYLHGAGGWAKSIQVIPGRNGASFPYGSCTSSNLRSVSGWISSANSDYDYGCIILPPGCNFGNQVGYFGFAVRNDSDLLSMVLNNSGYPGDKPSGTQWFNARKAKSVNSRRIFYDIDTYGGQSGSPVWYLTGASRYAVGIHTYGAYSGNSATRIVTPVFNNMIAWKALGV